MTGTVGAVVIGRNEGERLHRCLTSLTGEADRIVYVDSGSRDGSVAFARGQGVIVVELDPSVPFTAARGRNAGFEALRAQGLPDYVQFVDGDCAVEPGWIAAARDFLNAHPDVAIVTGWRTELHPDASLYNALAETEWHRPAGDIAACGGDMMVRTSDFLAVGGFDGRIIASEDEEFVIRVRGRGRRAVRLPRVMTRHDMAMTRFSAFWRRAVRSGHGFAEVGRLHPAHFLRERQRAWVYGFILPVFLVCTLFDGSSWTHWVAIAVYVLNWLRTARGLQAGGMARGMALRQAALILVSKLPNFIGMAHYWLRRASGRPMRIIEYK